MTSRAVPDPQVGALLRQAWQHLQAHLTEGLTAAGFDDLRPVHRPFQQYPGIDGLRPSEIAARHGLSKQAANDLMRDLEELGYVRLEPDPTDGRARLVRYTDRGWSYYRTASRLSRQVGRRWAAALGEERFRDFERFLQDVLALESGQGVDP